MKRFLQILLAVAILGLVYVVYQQVAMPLNFEKELSARRKVVVERLENIRIAERAYKTKYGRFTGSFDTLIQFVLNDELQFERRLVDEDDSVAMAQLKRSGRKNSEIVMVRAIDTVFSPRHLTPEQVRNLRYVPFTNHSTEFGIDAMMLTTESNVVIPVVEVRVPYKAFLDTVKYREEVINLIDDRVNNYGEYGGLKFGSLEKGNNEAGNWGDE